MKMVSMAKTPEQVNDEIKGPCCAPMSTVAKNVPSYPYGLCLSLEKEQLDALGIDGECDVGDTIHLSALAEVTSCSERKTEGGTNCRVELQITHLGIVGLEDEDEESGEGRATRRYGAEHRKSDGDVEAGDQPLEAAEVGARGSDGAGAASSPRTVRDTATGGELRMRKGDHDAGRHGVKTEARALPSGGGDKARSVARSVGEARRAAGAALRSGTEAAAKGAPIDTPSKVLKPKLFKRGRYGGQPTMRLGGMTAGGTHDME